MRLKAAPGSDTRGRKRFLITIVINSRSKHLLYRSKVITKPDQYKTVRVLIQFFSSACVCVCVNTLCTCSVQARGPTQHAETVFAPFMFFIFFKNKSNCTTLNK